MSLLNLERLKLDKLGGHWYQFASTDRKPTQAVTYDYEPREQGDGFNVTKHCHPQRPQQYHLRVTDQPHQLRLKRKGLFASKQDYVIKAVWQGRWGNYDWLLVGDKRDERLTVLTREPLLTCQRQKQLRGLIEANGYDWSALTFTPQVCA